MRNLRTADAPLVTTAEKINLLQAEIERVIRGKAEAVRLAIVTLLAGGHLLVEDVPGVGKTTLAHALARALQAATDKIPRELSAGKPSSTRLSKRRASMGLGM